MRRKFRSQTSDNMDRLKAEMERVREKRRIAERRSEKRKSQKKEDADARKVGKSRVSPMICGSNTPGSDHFWKLRCRKSARRCSAKHISKSTCTKHLIFRALLEVAMSKNCTLLWREAHFEVEMYKTHHVRTTLGRSELVSRGRRKGLCTFPK